MRSSSFFESARFPAMRFTSTQIAAAGDGTRFTLVGDLT
ncbi:YceI family protein, partial [Actinopolymorpha pittospori]